MTTIFFDNKICTFKFVLSWRFPRENSALDDFPLCSQGPPSKSENFIFIVVSPALSLREIKIRMQAVKWVVAKLQGDKTTSFCRKMSGREVTGR